MARLTSFSCIVLFCILGCQTTRSAGPPARLAERLTSIESDRLSGPEGRQVSVGRAVPTNPYAALSPNVVGTAHSTDAAPLLLSETGDTYSYYQDEQATETVDLSDASTTGEDGYARKGPLPSFWETVKRDVKEMPSELWRDTKRVYANPLNLVILGGTYGGALTLRYTKVDRSIERHFNRRHDLRPAHHHFKEDWRDAFGAIGNPGTHFALAGAWYLLGQQTMDEKHYEVGKTLFSALMINGLTVMVGQAATYDKAPNGEYGTFPSGHTSSSFVVASVLHQAYGHVVGIPLYGLATLAGYERVEDGEHYLSDVVMGGVLGLVVGHSVASGRDPEFFGWKVVPWASPDGGAGVAFAKSLD